VDNTPVAGVLGGLYVFPVDSEHRVIVCGDFNDYDCKNSQEKGIGG
jgi:hypothetical protein